MDLKIPTLPAARTAGANGAVDPQRLRQLGAIADNRQRAEALATQLESIFMGMMTKAMRATVPDGGVLGKGLGGDMYVEMLDQQWTQLGGMPQDPRFHSALVRQILQAPAEAIGALSKANKQ